MIYNNLIFNNTIINHFKKYVDTNSIPNAFLFYGNEGSGKFGHAVELANMILSKKDINEQTRLNKIKKNLHENINYILPLPKSRAISKNDSALKTLRAIDIENIYEQIRLKLSNPYHKITIEKANTILINSIRDIKKKISLSNHNNQWNIYIIMNAEKLCIPKPDSANALLKILEEPNDENLFILITSNISQMLETITSRCIKVFFSKSEKELIENYLNEKNASYKDNSALVSSICNGNITSSLELIDSFDKRLEIFDKTIQLLFDYDPNAWNNFTKKLKNINEIKGVLDLLLIFFFDIMIYKEYKTKNKLKFQNYSNKIITLSEKYSTNKLEKLIDLLNNAKQDIDKNVFISLLLTSLYIQINQILNKNQFNKMTFNSLNLY